MSAKRIVTIARLEAAAMSAEYMAAELERRALENKPSQRVRMLRKAADLSRKANQLRSIAKGQRTVSARLERQSQEVSHGRGQSS